MFRLEFCLLIIICFISYLYISSADNSSPLHKVFSYILAVMFVHLIFDMITIYTVNHLDSVPIILNDIFHRFFIGTMVLETYLFYQYIEKLIEEDSGIKLKTGNKALISLIIFEIAVLILPVHYAITALGNYSDGIHASVCYISVGVYLFMCCYNLFKYYSSIQNNKKFAIVLSLFIEVSISLLQAFNPTWLISSMGMTLIILAFYLVLENPDIYKAELVESRMSLLYLKSQINPHFLYNTLDSIRIEAELNNDPKTAKLLMKLVTFFRLSVKENASLVDVENEVELIENYMELMCYRYPSLKFNVNCDPELLSVKVPNFIIQPLLENSLKYGLKNKAYSGSVNVDIVKAGEKSFNIIIEDDGTGMDEKTMNRVENMLCDYKKFDMNNKSIGILNVQKRVKMLCGRQYGLSYFNNDKGGLTATLTLPIREYE